MGGDGEGPMEWRLGQLSAQVAALKEQHAQTRRENLDQHEDIRDRIKDLHKVIHDPDLSLLVRFGRQLAHIGLLGFLAASVIFGYFLKTYGLDPTTLFKELAP